VRLEDTEWTDCHVGTDGGAVLIFSERIAVSDSVFADSSAETYGGGAVLDGPEELLVERSVFTDDTAPTGGGLWVGPFASVVVRDSVFARNVSTVAGGGIYGHAGDTTLQGNRFDQNVSFSGGGAAWEGMGSLEALWNVFAGNVAERGSACDVIAASDIGFHNNLVLRNAGSTACRLDARGGGVPVVANNAFVDNAGGEEAAHLWTPPSGSRPEVVANVFFGGEGDGAAVLSAPAAAAAHAAYNDFWDAPSPSFGGAVDEEATLYADPRFVAPERDDYRLAAGSPCVDAGDPAVARNDPDGTRNDIGAFGGPAGAWTPPPYP
jgi:predicted outer membrane repeat protein